MLNGLSRQIASKSPVFTGLLGMTLLICLPNVVGAQAHQQRTVSGFTPRLTMVPQRGPRPAEQVTWFVDSLTSNDAMFEVVIGQGRLLTLRQDIVVAGEPSPLIATGDPSVIDFEIVGPRHIRVTGRRIGVTDLSIVTSDRQVYSFEVQAVADLDILRAQLRQIFPAANLKLRQLRDHVVVEGQARDTRQVAQIIQTIKLYLVSVQASQATTITGRGTSEPSAVGGPPGAPPPERLPQDFEGEKPPGLEAEVSPEGERPDVQGQIPPSEVINLIRVPGPQQVLLKVQIAELNRRAFREIGLSFLFQDSTTAFGSNISGGIPGIGAEGGDMAGFARLLNPLSAGTTVFGVFGGGNFNYFVQALRRNGMLKILAEPNLMAMHGQEASFLSGGSFPVPVPQSGAVGGTTAITIEYKEFGVSLKFVPYIIDGETIRLSVSPEVSSIDFTLGIETQGTSVPALNERKASTVVELRQGQTLAIAGLLQLEQEGITRRIPVLGDLPYIGRLFSNTSSRLVEKELIVLVTPYLVEPMNPDQVPPVPGAEVTDPDDFELYLLGQIEGRTGFDFRATTAWDQTPHARRLIKLEQRNVCGPHGYSP